MVIEMFQWKGEFLILNDLFTKKLLCCCCDLGFVLGCGVSFRFFFCWVFFCPLRCSPQLLKVKDTVMKSLEIHIR